MDALHSPTLEVNLTALRSNYRLLKDRHRAHQLACVVKANAYGLGVAGVARALHAEGCNEFFVATLEEGIELRAILPDAQIGVFNGLMEGEGKDYAAYRLMPVLNDGEQVERFNKLQVASCKLQAILHVDTGMTRLGLNESNLKNPLNSQLATCNVQLIMSHLACADEPSHPQNAQQLERFKRAVALFPGIRASLTNSAGLFLSPEFHFDVARPGCALYGINPTEGKNPMQHVATLSAPLLQLRTLEHDEMVGYDASYQGKKGDRVAIAALGYADGWLRELSNKGFAYIGEYKAPIIGRISMDMLALDMTSIPEAKLVPDARAEFINTQQTVDEVAALCDTIGYEIFTRIGRRVKRMYS